MTDQRSAFRFRIPRLRPSVPPPRPTTQTTRRRLPPPKLPIRPQVDPSPPPPQGTAPGPPAASTLPSEPSPPPPLIRPQGITPVPPPPRPLPVVQSPPQAAPASPTPPLPIRPQSTTPAPLPTPALLVTSSPSQEPAASPPTEPVRPLGTVLASPPEPLVEPSTSTQPIHPFGTVPASHQSHQLNHQRHHTPALQDEPNPAEATPSSPLHSSLPKLKTAKLQESSKTKSPPSSSSQTTIQSRLSSQPPSPSPSHTSTQPHFVSAKPPSPSTRSPPTSQPSSPSRDPSPPPEVKRSTETASSNGQRGAHLVLNATPTTETNEEASMELSSEHSNSEPHIRKQPKIKTQNAQENQHESEEDTISTSSNIPKTPKTKSMISLPEDKIPVPESPKNLKLNGPQTLSSKKTTSINLPNHYSNEKSPIVITLAGENRGTSIHIGSGAAKRHWKIHIHRKYKVNPDEITDTTTDGEESSEEKKKENDLKPNENKEKDAYINCNVQGINNSVVFNSSVTERNPGVYRDSSSKPLKKPKRNKVKVNITPSQSQTHTIRRRCLRGLFMESSSDSDPNGPQKPRRHGCRRFSRTAESHHPVVPNFDHFGEGQQPTGSS